MHKNQCEYNQIQVISMSHREARHNSVFHGSSDGIKKGLEKIKQAQIQVMRELRRDDPEAQRNHSLTYSKQTVSDIKNGYNFKFGTNDNPGIRVKTEKLEKEVADFTTKENKLRQEVVALGEQARKCKQACLKAQSRMKEYEKGQQKALIKAQQALSNAISSEKKYIQLKNEYDKVYKQKDRLVIDLKRLQTKSIGDLVISNEGEPQLTNRVIKQLRAANECFTELIMHINSHKCLKKDSKTNSHNSTNAFAISTFECQSKLDKHVNNLIICMNNLQSFAPIQQISSRIYAGQAESQNYLSRSFKDDIRKIQEQMDQAIGRSVDNQKISELEMLNKSLNKKLKKYETEAEQSLKQINTLKLKNKQLKSETQMLKLNQIVQKQINGGGVSKQKRSLFQKYKQLGKMSQSAPVEEFIRKYNSIKSNSSLKYGPDTEKTSQAHCQFLEDRILQLQKQNAMYQEMLKQSIQKQKLLSSQIKRLTMEMEQTRTQKQSLLNELSIKQQLANASMKSVRNQEQIQQMIDVISKLKEEREIIKSRETLLTKKLQSESTKYQMEVEELQSQLQNLKKQLDDMRRQSVMPPRSSMGARQPRMTDLLSTSNNGGQIWNRKQEVVYKSGSTQEARRNERSDYIEAQSQLIQLTPNNEIVYKQIQERPRPKQIQQPQQQQQNQQQQLQQQTQQQFQQQQQQQQVQQQQQYQQVIYETPSNMKSNSSQNNISVDQIQYSPIVNPPQMMQMMTPSHMYYSAPNGHMQMNMAPQYIQHHVPQHQQSQPQGYPMYQQFQPQPYRVNYGPPPGYFYS